MRVSTLALQFMANLFRPGIDRITPKPTFFRLDDGQRLEVDLYRPRRESLGTLLMVHGMNTRAQRDPRLIAASQAFAGVGFTVYTPRFPDVGRARIHYASVERIAGAIQRTAERAGHPVGVFAPSFSAAMSLIATTHPEADGAVSAVFAMGTYCDPRAVIRFLLQDESAHAYGRLIVLRNFLHRSVGAIERLEAALDVAIEDAALRRKHPLHPAHFAALPPRERELLEGVLEDVRIRTEHMERMLAADHDRLLDRMSLPSIVERVTVPVTLFHGAGDDVIPPQESIQLAQLLDRQGCDVHLNVSPLISHGDTQSFWKQRQAVFDAVRTFGHFFGHVSRPARIDAAAA